jgi:hypothetical protein
MTGRIYSVQFTGVAVTAQQDFFEINAASTKMTWLLALYLSQSTEVGDAQEEGLSLLIKTGATTSGSGGTTPTAVPRHLGDAAYAGTVEANNTTKATSGTIVTHHADNWNVRIPYQLIFTPELWIPIAPSGRLTVELGTTPADSITLSGTALICETG